MSAMTQPIPDRTPADHTSGVQTSPSEDAPPLPRVAAQKPGEIGGPAGPEPTRYGDWESKGRCTDF